MNNSSPNLPTLSVRLLNGCEAVITPEQAGAPDKRLEVTLQRPEDDAMSVSIEPEGLAPFLFEAAGDSDFRYQLCVQLPNGLAVGVRMADPQRGGLSACVTRRGSYLDPKTFQGPPEGDDKVVIGRGAFLEFLHRVAAAAVSPDDDAC